MRLFDLNPMVDIGITPEQGWFADVLLLMCLFRDSLPISSREKGENDENKRRVVTRGRQPDLQLLVYNREQPLKPMAHELFDEMAPMLVALDAACHDVGRDPATLTRSVEVLVRPGGTPDDGADANAGGSGASLADEREISGEPSVIAAGLRRFADLGIDHLQVQLRPNSIEGVAAFAPVIEALADESLARI